MKIEKLIWYKIDNWKENKKEKKIKIKERNNRGKDKK